MSAEERLVELRSLLLGENRVMEEDVLSMIETVENKTIRKICQDPIRSLEILSDVNILVDDDEDEDGDGLKGFDDNFLDLVENGAHLANSMQGSDAGDNHGKRGGKGSKTSLEKQENGRRHSEQEQEQQQQVGELDVDEIDVEVLDVDNTERDADENSVNALMELLPEERRDRDIVERIYLECGRNGERAAERMLEILGNDT